MTQIQATIVKTLKQELEYTDSNSYSQWILGISIKEYKSKDTYTARVIVKTNESPYVDGMDIRFTIQDKEVIIDPNYYKNTPEFQGGTVKNSINWLRQNGNIYYLQLESPFTKDSSNFNKVDDRNVY